MNKKGFIADIGLYIVLLFAVAVSFVVIYYLVTAVNTTFQDDAAFTTEGKAVMSNFKDRFVGIYDTMFVMLVIGFIIVLVITAFALRSHPVFAFLTILVLIVFAIVAINLANTYYTVAQNSELMTAASEMSKMTWLMTRLPHIAIVAGIVFIIILFAKSRNDSVSL